MHGADTSRWTRQRAEYDTHLPRHVRVSLLVYPILLHLSFLFSRDSLFTSLAHVARGIITFLRPLAFHPSSSCNFVEFLESSPSHPHFTMIVVRAMLYSKGQRSLNSYAFHNFVDLLENSIFCRMLSVSREYVLCQGELILILLRHYSSPS